ncbi:MAG: GntR family transcriptional regulator [Anaerolineales bacterium]|nr:GntR family transcriptional regulator [Anaerolineales bacterium]
MLQNMVRPPTLVATVKDTIRDSIYEGEYEPGSPLRESNLCEVMNISRSTVREALRELQEEGIVEIQPHRGAFVTELSPRTIRELYALREVLEPYAVRMAMNDGSFNQDVLNDLDSLVMQMGESERGGKRLNDIKADAEFHQRICEPCDNELLNGILGNLQSKTTLCIQYVRVYDPDDPSREVAHQEILDAIRTGDPDHAGEVVRKHVADAGARLLARLERMVGE